VSKVVGDEEVERRSWSNDVGGGSGRRSVSGQKNNEALVPYFLTRLPDYGSALLIHSNTPPAHISGRRWWEIKGLRELVPTPEPAMTDHNGRGPWRPTPPRQRRVVPASLSDDDLVGASVAVPSMLTERAKKQTPPPPKTSPKRHGQARATNAGTQTAIPFDDHGTNGDGVVIVDLNDQEHSE